MKSLIRDIFLVVCFGIGLYSFFALMGHRKAEAFNRLTGNHVTAWDALWIDLRITDTISPREIPQLDPAPTGNLNSPTRLRPR